jgi:antitoxin component YwqK of YwqJK toxin-antitoxin module
MSISQKPVPSSKLRVQDDQLDDGDDDAVLFEGKPFSGVSYDVYDNGQLRHEVEYVDGYERGLSRYWYSNGQLKEEMVFLPGRAPDKSTGWHENGKLRYETRREFGVKVSHKEWGPDGNLLKEETVLPGTVEHERLAEYRRTGAPWPDGRPGDK